MNYQHESLAAGRWHGFSLIEQLANIGSEVERALLWRKRNRQDYSLMALERSLELLDLTIADPRHRLRLRELTRLREALLDYFMGENAFQSTEESWRNYFYSYAYAARMNRGQAPSDDSPRR